MRNSLHAHIVYLENLIQDVRNRLTRHGITPDEFEDLQLQLTLAEDAIEHYRQAYALELSAAGSEPPDGFAGGNSDANAKSDNKSQPKKRDGLAAIATAVRKNAACRAARRSGVAWPPADLGLIAKLS